MRAGLAFWAGVIGAAVMVLGMWIFRMAGVTGFNFGYWWGSLVTGNITVGSWWLAKAHPSREAGRSSTLAAIPGRGRGATATPSFAKAIK